MKSAIGVDVRIITLKNGADVSRVQVQLRHFITENINVLTKKNIADEKAYWNDITPIRIYFLILVSSWGLFVGLVYCLSSLV